MKEAGEKGKKKKTWKEARENSLHLATLPLVSPPNDV